MISDKRKTIYLIILLSACIVILLILMMNMGVDQTPHAEPVAQDEVIMQDDSPVADSNVVEGSNQGIEPLGEPIASEESDEVVLQDVPGDVWKAAFDTYEKKHNAAEIIEAVMPQITEHSENEAELNANLSAMESFFSYWDKANEKDFVNMGELTDDLPDDNSLCIVILGFSLSPSGEVKDELLCRLDAGIEAAEKYPNAYILVTGGGTALMAPSVKEADKMAEYLIEKGIDPSRIIVENESLSTSENAVYSERIIRNNYPEIRDIFIVTSDYHVPMACSIFNGWFIMMNSDLKVISNYACDPGSLVTFKIKDQVYWMKELLYFYTA
ncbi:MAG: YdcF family protein [Lachnospiraceae bacterium]|nr:YdcF family protein [Lachnospiraceae bacterium]